MDLSMTLNRQERAMVESQATAFNRALNGTREVKQTLDRDDFLRILITQLQNQDPTSPMEDKEFIAQMAQFSTLEQMTNMSGEFSRLTTLLATGQSTALLGRTVELADAAGETVVGTVGAITTGTNPQIMVNETYYDVAAVQRVLN